MIKYIGSKRLLIGPIVAAAKGFGRVETALDLFSGTARVGRALKNAGLRVIANDHLAYAATLARCYVAADGRRWREPARALLEELSGVASRDRWFTQAYCRDARYFQPCNGARAEGIREAIAARDLPPELEAIALTSLMEAVDRVDSTTGVQMAYLKRWAKRSYKELTLRLPELTDGEGEAWQREAEDAATAEVDVAYLDPPYNQHSYLGNYHVWETLVRWDEPETYGVANKRLGCKTYKNAFNSRVRMADALGRTIERLRAKHLVVSFNDEGFLDRAQLEAMLSKRGHVRVVSTDFKRYVGAQIGVYDPQGKKVGKVSHLRNQEMLFCVSPDAGAADRAVAAAASALTQ